MFFVYILRSLRDESFYVGFTKDPDKRLLEHNKGRVRYTKGHIPYELVHIERFMMQKDAKNREVSIKKTKNIRAFLKKQTSSPDSAFKKLSGLVP